MMLFLFNQLFHSCIFTALGSDAPQKTEMFIVLFLFSLLSARTAAFSCIGWGWRRGATTVLKLLLIVPDKNGDVCCAYCRTILFFNQSQRVRCQL